MFQKENLIKRYIFLGLDLLAVTISALLANFLRFGEFKIWDYDGLYVQVYIVAITFCVVSCIAFKVDKHVFDRGIYRELMVVARTAIMIGVACFAYLFLSQEGIHYSRLMMGYFLLGNLLLSYLFHLIAKPTIAAYYKSSRSYKKIMLISSSDKVEQILEKFRTTNNWYFDLAYLAIVDKDMRGMDIDGIPVIACGDDMLEASKNITLDGVFINVSYAHHAGFDVQKTLQDFQSLGIVVHVNIDALELDVTDKVIENLGFFKVVSYTSRLLDPTQLVIKRCMDVVGGLIGLVLTLLVGIVIVPIIKIQSPGPAIFKQTRVGKNGRHFKMYKFRSMYQDADARKADLETQNEMKGAMFKIADDPRITRIGRFMRKYSIDELPQFWNVLKGDMSLVGTRPPTVDEVEQYKVKQKRRLSVTPGMTGLWQVSGRNRIDDFDHIVRLDLMYIDKWSVGLDIKLIVKTILVCFKGDGK